MLSNNIIVHLWNIKKDVNKFYNKKVNYCGTYERQAFFTKWFPIQKFFPGINLGCYYHDARYSVVFKNPHRNIFNLLGMKLIVDIIFYLEMLRYSVLKLSIRGLFLFSFRLIIATLFFIIVVIGTPYYLHLFKKQDKKVSKQVKKRIKVEKD